MCSEDDEALKYHLSLWKEHYSYINSYYDKLSGRFTIVFGILSAFVAFICSFNIFDLSEINNIQLGILLSSSMLIPLFFIQEMKIYLRLISDYSPMLYHALILLTKYNKTEFRQILMNSFIDSSPLTMLFMILSNILVLIVNGFSILIFSLLLNTKKYSIYFLIISSIFFLGYIVGVMLTYKYTKAVHENYDNDVLNYLKENVNCQMFIFPQRVDKSDKKSVKKIISSKHD